MASPAVSSAGKRHPRNTSVTARKAFSLTWKLAPHYDRSASEFAQSSLTTTVFALSCRLRKSERLVILLATLFWECPLNRSINLPGNLTSSRVLAFALLGATSLCAQSTNANLSGTVTDQTGALIPNAQVTVTDKSTGVIHHATTDSNGSYSVPQLQPDPYTISFLRGRGSAPRPSDNVVLAVQIDRRVDGHLTIGAQETVDVSDTATLQVESAALQDSVSERQVRELPLLVGGETAGRSLSRLCLPG